jgi:hypothetical protein
VLVDNYVEDVLVNGKSTGARLPPDRLNTETARTITIPAAAFAPGTNRIDVVVYNEKTADSPMALLVEWTARAAPSVAR